MRKGTNVQPEVFQSSGGFIESGNFNEHFIKKTQVKKAPQEKNLEFFLLDSLNTTFWMEILTQEWHS